MSDKIRRHVCISAKQGDIDIGRVRNVYQYRATITYCFVFMCLELMFRL